MFECLRVWGPVMDSSRVSSHPEYTHSVSPATLKYLLQMNELIHDIFIYIPIKVNKTIHLYTFSVQSMLDSCNLFILRTQIPLCSISLCGSEALCLMYLINVTAEAKQGTPFLDASIMWAQSTCSTGPDKPG